MVYQITFLLNVLVAVSVADDEQSSASPACCCCWWWQSCWSSWWSVTSMTEVDLPCREWEIDANDWQHASHERLARRSHVLSRRASRLASAAGKSAGPRAARRGEPRPVRRCWWVVAPRGSALIRRRDAVTGECRVQHSTSDLKQPSIQGFQGQSWPGGPGVQPDSLDQWPVNFHKSVEVFK